MSDDVKVPAREGQVGLFIYCLAIFLFVYSWLSVNIYLPILPELENILGTSPNIAQLTVTGFLIGFSFSQLIWGPLSDRFGRRPILIAGLAISMTGAALTGFTSDITMFFAARLLESIGAGVAPVLARSILSDSLERPQVAVVMAYAAMTVALVPAVAPIIGGYLDLLMSWRSIFFFLAFVGMTLFFSCLFRLEETNKNKVASLRMGAAITGYATILCNRRFLGYLFAYSLAFGSLIGYYSEASFLFVTDLNYKPHQYGFLLIFNAACYVAGSFVSRMLVPRIGSDRVILLAIAAFIIAASVFFIFDVLIEMSTFSVLFPACIFIFGCALVSPASNAGAMTIFRDKAGASTAVIGFSTATGGALFNAGVSTLHFSALWELGVYVAVVALLSILSFGLLLRSKDTQSEE
ncbi:MAG: multidrug effflux MFS transporter [Stappiaceae bacterium]